MGSLGKALFDRDSVDSVLAAVRDDVQDDLINVQSYD